jgi:nicotinate-nucleotide pyrophosphorylase (carboxylating)
MPDNTQLSTNHLDTLPRDIKKMVTIALEEDIGDGDITAELIPAGQTSTAQIITREDCIIAGTAWVDEVFRQLDYQFNTSTEVIWHIKDGQSAAANSLLFELKGNARTLLTGERSALNFLQLLSGTATKCQAYADKVKHTNVRLLDTRKTIPGLRTAQKYAVTCGDCYNHRIGLYDAFLIKENHIAACGGISLAIQAAKKNHAKKPVEIEVESLDELQEALKAGADSVMLDNFTIDELKQGVAYNHSLGSKKAKLEASGNVNQTTLVPIAQTGVDFISIGALTKDCQAIDLSMKFSVGDGGAIF